MYENNLLVELEDLRGMAAQMATEFRGRHVREFQTAQIDLKMLPGFRGGGS